MKRLLLHSCCAPCLTSVYEQLNATYEVAVFWYNPNIWPKSEHDKRLKVLTKYCKEHYIKLYIGNYNYEEEHAYWVSSIAGLEDEPERGKRCEICYKIRLEATAWVALEKHFNLFASELSVSPHKDAKMLNDLGEEISDEVGVEYLVNDFKKGNGYKRSVEISKERGLYRQDYCGCEHSISK
jgi:predicted adenine nucleotide alpha hydrolase (AANH) superfamily ATPase